VIPTVRSNEEFWEMKKRDPYPRQQYEDIELPKNTGMGIYISCFAFLFGFALVWHILWLALLGLIGVIACIIIRSMDDNTEYVLTAAEVEQMERSKVQ
jgi:cytochrome o ubiquinol oxidase subunit 1